MAEIIDPSNYQDFTLEMIKTPTGIAKLNSILRQLSDNISGDTESVRIFSGVGTPEGSVAAGVGSLYMRTDGGSNTSVYRKESGSDDSGWVAITAPASLPLSVANGGTGSDNSAVVQGVLPYFSATGVISGLATGTSGYFLKTQGAGANPTWDVPKFSSNCLFQYTGQVDAQGAGLGEVSNASLTVASATVGLYRYLQGGNAGAYTQVWSSKFVKIAGISTVTVWARIWTRSGADSTANVKVDIGGQNGNVSGTANSTTPEWKSFTIDVSGLSNGTTYDVAASLKDVGASPDTVRCSDIIGFGS